VSYKINDLFFGATAFISCQSLSDYVTQEWHDSIKYLNHLSLQSEIQ